MTDFSLQGHFLLSMQKLNGSYFGQTLILLCEHNPDGALGLILNKSTDVALTEMLAELDLVASADVDAESRKVFEGGPVAQDRGFVVHEQALTSTDCLQLADSLYISGATAALTELLTNPDCGNFHVLLGYAGWGAGQLEEELKDNSWLTVEAQSSVVFDTPNSDKLLAAAAQLGIDYRLLADAGYA